MDDNDIPHKDAPPSQGEGELPRAENDEDVFVDVIDVRLLYLRIFGNLS